MHGSPPTKRASTGGETPADHALLGEIVGGRYELKRLIGAGGTGTVFEARHTETHRSVALKVLIGEDLTVGSSRLARFRREARVIGRLDTPHIVQVLDSGVDERVGAPFMAMPLLLGEDLSQLLERVASLRPGASYSGFVER